MVRDTGVEGAEQRPRAGSVALACALALFVAGESGARARAPLRQAPDLGPKLGSGAPEVTEAQDPELEELLAEERREADRLRRRGRPQAALEILDELLEDDASDARALSLRSLARFDLGRYDEAEADAREARRLGLERGLPAEERARLARRHAHVLLELGRAAEALALSSEPASALEPDRRGGDAWALGRALLHAGRRADAEATFDRGARTPREQGWADLLGKGRCLRALQRYELASDMLVAADRTAAAGEGTEPEVLVELGELYFEVDGEVEHDQSMPRRPADLYREALALAPGHEGALLGLFELHRLNWKRQRRDKESYLDELFAQNSESIRGLLAGLATDLDDGHLPRARARLARLESLAPERRDVRTEKAALAWIEHRRDDAEAELAELVALDPADGRPERDVGRHLIELYRFAEALPFLRHAVERAPRDFDAWIALGRALANTGDEDAAREALNRAEEVSSGRQNAWRHNTALVLKSMDLSMVEDTRGDLTFVWRPDESGVLSEYFAPFYRDARTELSRRYGYTAEPVRIEVFRQHKEFSMRSVGFEGFPALGVCFGPVVTSLSPLCELRGTYSWARTAYHEFTHVIHLGLSHNRCPRWITEGLATWEEVERDPTWSRNMRRELLDARANGEIIPVRELNASFRSDRILFGYYQGGLLCDLLIGEHGFPPMVRVLEAFDRGLDLDETLRSVYGMTPEELDLRFAAYVDSLLADLHLEARWNPAVVKRIRLGLARTPPADPGARAQWADGWTTVAWGRWQQEQKVDAQEALRLLEEAGGEPPRARFLRGEMAIAAGRDDEAIGHWTAGLDAGGEDYRVRMALGRLARRADDRELALAHFLAAERAFPGYAEPHDSAELSLARLYDELERKDDAMAARERWLEYQAGDYDTRVQVARWHAENGRHAEAARLYSEANEVDPFSSRLHFEWGRALLRAGRPEEALRELSMVRRIPQEHDRDPRFLTEEAGKELDGLLAECRAPKDAERRE